MPGGVEVKVEARASTKLKKDLKRYGFCPAKEPKVKRLTYNKYRRTKQRDKQRRVHG